MNIRHNSYFDGKVQTLTFESRVSTAVHEYTLCVVEAGEYDFGVAEHATSFRYPNISFAHAVNSGKRSIPRDGSIEFRKGERIIFSCTETAVFIWVHL